MWCSGACVLRLIWQVAYHIADGVPRVMLGDAQC